MNFYKITAITAAMAALMLSSCSSTGDRTDLSGSPVDDDDMAMRITVTVPDATGGRAAMSDADESQVDDLLVLLFSVDGSGVPQTLYKACAAQGLTPGEEAGSYDFDVRFPVTPGTTPERLAVVTVANAASRLADVADGSAYSAVATALTAAAPAATDTRLTLWGRGDKLIDTSLRAQSLRLKLLRDRARIDLSVDEALPASRFTLASLHVVKALDKMALIPADECLDAEGKAVKPTIPASATALADPLTVTGTANLRLYLAEADVVMGGTGDPADDNRFQRPAMVVGGYYAGASAPSYYRVDFALPSGTLIDLLRNHRYRVNITAVNGPGEATPEEAYLASKASISATVTPWDDVELDVEFDGGSWVAMPRTATVGASAGSTVELAFSTNVDPAGWTAEWTGDNDGDNFSYTLPDALDDNKATLKVTALTSLPASEDSRTAQLLIQVTPRLRVIVNIVQSRSTDSSQHKPWEDQGILGEV